MQMDNGNMWAASVSSRTNVDRCPAPALAISVATLPFESSNDGENSKMPDTCKVFPIPDSLP